MASTASEAGVSMDDTTRSSLPGRLTAGGVQLTSLSPLTDRRKLCASPALEHVALGLSTFGYQVGWDDGVFQVCPAGHSVRPADAPLTMSVDSFMGALTRKREGYGYRPKVASSLTFSRPGSSGTAGALGRTDARPASQQSSTSPAASPTAAPAHHLHSGSVRFSRMAQSVDSLQQLQVPVSPANVNARNLRELHSPGPLQHAALQSPTGSRPGTAPAASLEQLHAHRPSTADVASTAAAVARTAGAPSSSGEQLQRPATAQVDVGRDASAALRPSTSASSRFNAPSVPSRGGLRPGSRGGVPNPYRSFRPSRGHALVVFQHMDKDKNGKVTLSEMEDAALSLGFSLEQAHRIFAKLDREGKGYVHTSDWGNVELRKLVELFSLAYMQRFLGLPGPTSRPDEVTKYQRNEDIKAARTVSAAIDMARVNAVTRGAHSATSSGNVIFEAFRFIDADNSGVLSYDELRDGFYALGVYVKDDVMQQMIERVDRNRDGHVDYYEFVRSFFPGVSSALR